MHSEAKTFAGESVRNARNDAVTRAFLGVGQSVLPNKTRLASSLRECFGGYSSRREQFHCIAGQPRPRQHGWDFVRQYPKMGIPWPDFGSGHGHVRWAERDEDFEPRAPSLRAARSSQLVTATG